MRTSNSLSPRNRFVRILLLMTPGAGQKGGGPQNIFFLRLSKFFPQKVLKHSWVVQIKGVTVEAQ